MLLLSAEVRREGITAGDISGVCRVKGHNLPRLGFVWGLFFPLHALSLMRKLVAPISRAQSTQTPYTLNSAKLQDATHSLIPPSP